MWKVKMDIPLKLGAILRETHNFRRLLKPWNILFIQLVSAFTMILGNGVDLFWKKILDDLLQGVLNWNA